MKKAFTLLEIIISVILLFMILFTLTDIIKEIKSNENFFVNINKSKELKKRIFNVINNDFFLADNIQIINTSKNFDIILLHTKNSFYNMDNPYVLYYVSKKNNALIRIESLIKPNIKFLELTYMFFTNIDKITNNVELFKLYKNKKNNYILFYKLKNKKLNYFQLYL